jgi:hypothetical protein
LESVGDPLEHTRDDTKCVYTTVTTVATKDIRPGEELTCNYATFEYETSESCPCDCGAANCLGRIVGFGDLPVYLQTATWEDALENVRKVNCTEHWHAGKG